MDTLYHKNRMFVVSGLLVVLLLTTLACSLGGISVGKNSATLDISLTQDQINTLFKNIDFQDQSSQGDLLTKVTGVEMHDGFIRVLGNATKKDSSVVNGSFDVSISAENDLLKAQIIAVDIPDVDISDPRIVNANEKMQEGLSKSAMENNSNNNPPKFKEAVIKDGVLKLKIEVDYQTK
jgi:hypothetical protein